MSLQGFALVTKLRAEADDIANETRAELVRQVAAEIERLIGEWRALFEIQQKHQKLLDAVCGFPDLPTTSCPPRPMRIAATPSKFCSSGGTRNSLRNCRAERNAARMDVCICRVSDPNVSNANARPQSRVRMFRRNDVEKNVTGCE